MGMNAGQATLHLRAQSLAVHGSARPATLDAEIRRGDIVAIIGGRDQERRRWLMTLAGLQRPAAGRLQLLDYDSERTDAALTLRAHRRIGYVSADEPLLSTFSVRANVMLPRLYHLHESPDTARRFAEQVLDEVQYDGSRDILPAHLDRFRKQQVLLARALALEPQILFLHEPFELHAATEWNAIAQQLGTFSRDQQRTLVVATQNLLFTAAWADCILFLNDGGIRKFDHWDDFMIDSAGVRFLHAMPFRPDDHHA